MEAEMATASAQNRWRSKNRFVKSQLNVMARRLVHDDLVDIAGRYRLRGKGEAVGFSSYITKGLMQYANHNSEARRLLEIFQDSYERDRDLYA
tara:strand:+ start:527 stop:805 length:279 start_codon:yes stop_codon:yes gene_type:complete